MSKNGDVSVVLVHGAFVDGAGWEDVYTTLKRDGYDVSVVQHTTLSLEDDVAATKRAIAEQKHDVLLVGHSYGGAVITEAGNDPKVAGLVYIAGWVPAKGESVSTLLKERLPANAPAAPILPPQDGLLYIDKQKFPAAFAGDVDPDKAAFLADAQLGWGVKALGGVISEAAWASKPSWSLVTTEDRMIPPDTQRFMSKRAGADVVEQKGSHAIFLSEPDAVVALVEKAAESLSAR
jgi:pimeloyl-ACP methyl ester carboxylesterase